jgi:hypothetical protein
MIRVTASAGSRPSTWAIDARIVLASFALFVDELLQAMLEGHFCNSSI